MLEHVPHWLGEALRGLRAGSEKTVVAQQRLHLGDQRMELTSPAFPDGGRLPRRCTADGSAVSPPLAWNAPPAGTESFVLVVEDPDAPSSRPLVHGLVAGLPADRRELAEGAFGPGKHLDGVGRNSYLRRAWLAPDPPTGHGPHDYVFQLFALTGTPEIGDAFGRSELVEAMAGQVIAAGVLVGRYARPRQEAGSPPPVGRVTPR